LLDFIAQKITKLNIFQAGIDSGSLVIDPFVGSGSLIVAAAQFGACVVGSDIDYLMLHAKNKSSRVGQTKRLKGEHLKGEAV